MRPAGWLPLFSAAVTVALLVLVGGPSSGRAVPRPAARPAAAPELPFRDLLQLPMATVQALPPDDQERVRRRLESERARITGFGRFPLPKATTVPARVRAALPQTVARLVALDLERRKRGLPPVFLGDVRTEGGDALHQFPLVSPIFRCSAPPQFPGELLSVPSEHAAVAGPIRSLINCVALLSNLRGDVRVEVVPSVPFGVIFNVPERVVYVNAVLVALLPEAKDAESLRPELSHPKPPPDMSDPRRPDLEAAEKERLEQKERDDKDVAPCLLGTLCIGCTRAGCRDCGCQRELNSCCDQCERMNRDCSNSCNSCNDSCNKCNNDCTKGCTQCNSDCGSSCTRCGGDFSKGCNSCGNDCTRCNNDCAQCNNDCGKCSNDCGKCSNDCNNCGNECNRCGSDCNRCGNDCNRCGNDCNNCGNCGGGGCNNCQMVPPATPLMPPPLGEAQGVALFARAARDGLMLMLPPLLFLFLRHRLLRRRRAEGAGEAQP
jgi:hypothetical protein